MLRPLLSFLVALSFLWGGGAYADGPWTAWDNYQAAIRGAVQGSTLDEVIQWSNAQFARRAMVGRYVRWGGTIVIGSALVYAALDWFYRELRRQTGTPLDELYGSGQLLGYVAPSLRCGGSGGVYVYGYWYCPSCMNKWSIFYWTWPCSELSNRAQEALRIAPSKYASELSDFDPDRYDWVLRVFSDTFRIDIYPKRRSLEEILQSSPEARQALRDQVVAPYIDAHPIGSPSAPYPGVRLEPIPNPNQWTDNPFTRPDIDTDGDGWPDSIEWHEANRRGLDWPDVIPSCAT